MMKLLKIDEQGYFIEDIITDKIPIIREVLVVEGEEVEVEIPNPQYITIPCQGGFYRPMWNGAEWVEGMSQEEIDTLNNQPRPVTQEQRISDLELLVLQLGGVI